MELHLKISRFLQFILAGLLKVKRKSGETDDQASAKKKVRFEKPLKKVKKDVLINGDFDLVHGQGETVDPKVRIIGYRE